MKTNENVILSEYSAIKNELSSLFQKSGLLTTIITVWITFVISVTSYLISVCSPWFCIFFLFIINPLVSLGLNIKILIPDLRTKKDSKYFVDFANINDADELNEILNLENTKKQIIENAKILTHKYHEYKIALYFGFAPISWFFLINKKNQDNQNNVNVVVANSNNVSEINDEK